MCKMRAVLLFAAILLVSGTTVFAQPVDELEEGTPGEIEPSTGAREKPQFGFTMNFLIGLSSYEDIDGNQVAFQRFSLFPEFSYGKWGVGLDFTFEFDGDWKLRDLDKDGKADSWTTFTDYLHKFYYVRYGFKGDPIYGRIGAFSGYTLGHGLIMQEYSNTLFYPQVVQLGLNLDIDGTAFNFPYVGLETVVDDVLDWDIIGLRAYARPLVRSSKPLVSKLKLGATVVTDLDPQELPTDSPEDDPASESVTEFGLDVEMPLLERQDMSLIAYADWATISGKGSGSFIGSSYTYRWFTALAQLRFFGKQFVPSYFDPYYERERGTKYASLDAYDEFYVGYLIGTRIGIASILNFYFTWEDGFNDPIGPRVQTGIGTAENAIPKIEASILYDKKDIDSFEEFFSEEDSLMQLEVVYKVTTGAAIAFIYQRSYSAYSGDVTSRTLVETRFSF
jgi:hypothetical protein